METLNLTVPTSWAELSQHQLLHVFTCIAAGYNATQIKTCALIRWNGIDVLTQTQPHIHTIRKDKRIYEVSTSQIVAVLAALDYLGDVPSVPVRLEEIKGHKALAADFSEVPFNTFIMCDNLYQGYLHMQNEDLLAEMASILYDINEPITLTKAQGISIFYWWMSLKKHFGNMFPNFLKPSEVSEATASGNLYRQLSESMNAQIRALTKGDITKEKEVLAMDTWRALTELDAQAKEYDEMKRNSK